MARAGMDVARLNFSHGDQADHARFVQLLRAVSREIGRPLGILCDLAGPKIRVGELEGGERLLGKGEEVVLSSQLCPDSPDEIGTTYPDLAADLTDGCLVLLDDGRLRLKVTEIQEGRVRCRVQEGGVLKSHKGINLPGVPLSTPALTAKDRDDLAFALQEGVDMVALSFVRSARDVTQAVSLIRKLTGAAPVRRSRFQRPPFAVPYPPLIAKLEKPQALEDLDGILQVSGAVMVARGDLGVEIPPEAVPTAQKRIISSANALGRPVITATQMLESMTSNSRPTRAEASDVANAVLDGTDAVMLSAETAAGRYPVESVKMMDRIIREAETQQQPVFDHVPADSTQDAVAGAAVSLALDLDVACIVAFTQSGSTALRLARRRPGVPILALSPDEAVTRRLSLVWGVISRTMARADRLAVLVDRTERTLRDMKLARGGDRVVLVMGYPPGRMGRTDLVKLHEVGDAS